MDKKFILRLIFFILISVCVPVGYLCVKFEMFTTGVKMNVAELLCIILVISLGVVILKYYLSGMKTKYSYAKQIITGFIRVIVPLVIALFVLIWLDDNIYIVKEFLSIVIPCETVAVFINPLPKWAFNNNIDGLYDILGNLKKGEK